MMEIYGIWSKWCVEGSWPLVRKEGQHGPHQGAVIGRNKTISCLYPMSYTPNKSVKIIIITSKGFEAEKQSLLISQAKMPVINSYWRKKRKIVARGRTMGLAPHPAHPLLLGSPPLPTALTLGRPFVHSNTFRFSRRAFLNPITTSSSSSYRPPTLQVMVVWCSQWGSLGGH